MKRVGYLYNEKMATIEYFPQDHPMKPKRFKMAHSLISSMGLYRRLDIYSSKEASFKEMTMFHSKEYVDYLHKYVNPAKEEIVRCLPDPPERRPARKTKFNMTEDCPVYEGLYNFCQLAVGASLDCADLISTAEADIAINWAGGYHHAKKSKMSGFCYVNDIVICILELLKYYPRVLYLDVDVHHGDGVEEAFFTTNRVMTVSFHEYGDGFFPGTGSLQSRGDGLGLGYSLNVPLRKGITDELYFQLFKNVVDSVVEHYRPDVAVMQCGADSLSGDKLGHFNLSLRGHGNLVKHMMSKNIPLVLLGGGGYTIENVSRCWAYETALTVGIDIPDEERIPEKDSFFHEYAANGGRLHYEVDKSVQNENSKADLEQLQGEVLQLLRTINRPNCVALDPMIGDEEPDQENLFID